MERLDGGRYTGVIHYTKHLGKQEKESKSPARNAGERGKEKRIKKRQEEVGEGNIFPMSLRVKT